VTNFRLEVSERRTPIDGSHSERLITEGELLKMEENGQFLDESVKRKNSLIHSVGEIIIINTVL
jgi:hypothetical protein